MIKKITNCKKLFRQAVILLFAFGVTTIIVKLLICLGFLLEKWDYFPSNKDGWDISVALATAVGAVGTVVAALIALFVWDNQNIEAKRLIDTREKMASARLVRTVITLNHKLKEMRNDINIFGTPQFIQKYNFLKEGNFYSRYRDDLHYLTNFGEDISIKLSYAFGNLEGLSIQYEILISNSTLPNFDPVRNSGVDKSIWFAWSKQAEEYLYESIGPMHKSIGNEIFFCN